MAKKSKKKGGKGGKTGSSFAEVPPPPTTSTAPTRTPVTINDLPDELLDDIALFTDQKTLPFLALVERRFYEPARRQTHWVARGLKELLGLTESILESPQLSRLARDMTLEAFDAGQRPLNRFDPREIELAGRLIRITISECPNLRHLTVYPGVHTLPSQLAIAQELSTLTLRTAHVGDLHAYVSLAAFLAAVPGLRLVRRLCTAIYVGPSPARDIPRFPNIQGFCLTLKEGNTTFLGSFLEALAPTADEIHIVLIDHRSPSGLPLPTVTSLVRPHISHARVLSLEINALGSDLHKTPILDTLPFGGGWLQSCWLKMDMRGVWTSTRLVWGATEQDMGEFLDVGIAQSVGASLIGRRGPDWTPQTINRLEGEARELGLRIGWQ